MKKCTKCKEAKPLEEFHKRSASKDGRQSKCKTCNNASVRKWMNDNPEKFEANWKRHSYGDEALLKRKASRYGLTVEQLVDMMDKADGICEICQKPTELLVIDHCHTTMVVRGLICNKCNTALGLFGDDIEAMQRAIEYLNRLP